MIFTSGIEQASTRNDSELIDRPSPQRVLFRSRKSDGRVAMVATPHKRESWVDWEWLWMSPKLIAVFGRNGQVGTELTRHPLPDGWILRSLSRAEVDLMDVER